MPGPKKFWVPWRMTGKPISRKTSLEQYNFRKSGGGGGPSPPSSSPSLCRLRDTAQGDVSLKLYTFLKTEITDRNHSKIYFRKKILSQLNITKIVQLKQQRYHHIFELNFRLTLSWRRPFQIKNYFKLKISVRICFLL